MSRLHLVRHGHAAASWDADPDPGLSEAGRNQAAAMASALAPLGPLPVHVSPLRRCRETAAALERVWRCDAVIDPRVGEIASPGLAVAERGEWLRGVMSGSWDDVDDGQRAWSAQVVEALRQIAAAGDAVVVTHFIAINVALGAACGDRRVVVAPVDNCSITVLDVADGRLSVVEIGRTATTQIL